jgi:hypothetical protein
MMMFKRKYPYAHITIYKLRKLYREQRIKKKSVRISKVPNYRTLTRTQDDILDLYDDLSAAIGWNYRVVMLDEMMITKRTFPTHDWAKLHSNTKMDWSQMNNEPVAVLGAVSRERGIELMMTFPKSVNVPKFKIFLEELRRKNPLDNIILVMDNLAVHRNQEAVGRMR